MPTPWALLLLLLAVCLPVRADPVPTLPDDIQVQENFELSRIYGKWYNLAVGSTCPWLKRIKDRMAVSTLVLGEGTSETEISMTSTHWRRGVCEEISGAYEKTDTDGKFLYHKAKWNLTMESYVVHTNYDEYAIFLTKKFSRRHGPTITAKLYGREPQLRESLLQEFREVALGVGIPENSIFTMIDRGECVPGQQEPKPAPVLRTRRAVLPEEEEGSGTGRLVMELNKKEDSCQLGYSEGPCLGLFERYFYNGSSMACETFNYGGCLGNGNNFASEKECLQTCRTVAACSLPIVPGPCRGIFPLWAFDAVQGKCVLFNYGGCQGNGNKFYSEKECKEYCGKPGDELQTERKVFHLLIHSPNGPNGRSCADPRTGARSCFWVSHTGAGAQGLGSSSTAFPGHSRELDQKWSSQDRNRCPYGMLAPWAEA